MSESNEIVTHEATVKLKPDGSYDVFLEPAKILTPDKPYTADELSSMWPKLRGELLTHAEILEREPTVENAQVRVGIKAAVRMGDGYLSLRDAVWPGKPAWRPTEAEPQQDFFEAFAESLWDARKTLRKIHDAQDREAEPL